MNHLEEYNELARRIEDFILASTRDDFGELALAIHAFQLRGNEPYRNFCTTLPAPRGWEEIPAVPLDAFRHVDLIAFPRELIRKTFRTSGTTGEGFGQHHFLSLDLYEVAALAGWRHATLPEGNVFALVASEQEAGHSSLSHMAGGLTNRFYLSQGKFEWERLSMDLQRELDPVLLFGTALAFLDLFEWLNEKKIELPPGSLAVETGGYKGTTRSVPKVELIAQFQERLGLPADSVWNEYGMTELSSQFYTKGLGRAHSGGHWVKARVLDPQTGVEVADGEMGVLRIFDLANLGSVLALQTRDLAIRRGVDFELIGRDPAALPRGCSRTVG